MTPGTTTPVTTTADNTAITQAKYTPASMCHQQLQKNNVIKRALKASGEKYTLDINPQVFPARKTNTLIIHLQNRLFIFQPTDM